MILSLVSVDKQEFNEAKSGGFVYGYAQYGTARASVYVDLGQELKYYKSTKDDPFTSYRLFSRSTIYFAKTDEDLDNEVYSAILENSTVKIFC